MVDLTDATGREAGAAAERLLADPYLKEALDEMIQRHTDLAIRGMGADQREESRNLVLAILELRGTLRSVLESWRGAAAAAAAARARE